MKKLASYDNGNTHVDLYEDGTLERSFDETKPIIIDFPSSIDVKITNYCTPEINNPICAYCHESSGLHGAHGDLLKLQDVLSVLPGGQEIAAGGGDPLSHPHLISFLVALKTQGLITNITINQKHLKPHKELILSILEQDLVKGVGISYSSKGYLPDIKPILAASSNVVFHLIMGINQVEDVVELNSFCRENNRECKVLVLGYKEFGFGINYYLKNKKIEDNKYSWYTQLATHFKDDNLVVSFDNLGISQLKLQRYFTDEAWQMFYMGDDGTASMYLDGVKQQYAKSSTSNERVSFNDCSLLEYFGANKKSL